jgi:hypothetical protein
MRAPLKPFSANSSVAISMMFRRVLSGSGLRPARGKAGDACDEFSSAKRCFAARARGVSGGTVDLVRPSTEDRPDIPQILS